MTDPRSAAQEAQDPGTAPERLLRLVQEHPELHRALVQNPSTPEVARQWILAIDPAARVLVDEDLPFADGDTPRADDRTEDGDLGDGEAREDAPDSEDLDLGATAAMAPIVPSPAEAAPEPAAHPDAARTSGTAAASTASVEPEHEDPAEASVWGDLSPAPAPNTPPSAAPFPEPVSYTHLTLPTILRSCRSRWSPYH